MNDLNLAIGLRKLRIEKGFKQKKLAELSGVDANYISDTENSRRNPTMLTVEKLLKPLETSYVDFLVNYCDLTNTDKEMEQSWNAIEETEPNQFNFQTKNQITEHLDKVISMYEEYCNDLLKECSTKYKEDYVDLKETGYEYRLELDKILVEVEEQL